MHDDGIEEAVSIVLAPHFSTFSVKSYNGRAVEEAEKLGGLKLSIESWYRNQNLLAIGLIRLRRIYEQMPKEKEQSMLIVSAHSLPEKILQSGDPYPSQLQETADLIAEQAGIKIIRLAGKVPEKHQSHGLGQMFRI